MEFETTDISKLDTMAFIASNYLAHALPNGRMYKNTISNFSAFIAPYIAAIGASGFVAVTGTSLPTPDTDNNFTLVSGPNIYTHSGGNVTTTKVLNILSWNGTVWSLATEIDVDLNDYLKKEEIGIVNVLLNSDFSLTNSAFSPAYWEQNEAFIFTYDTATKYTTIKTTGTSNPAIYQNGITFTAGKWVYQFRIRRVSSANVAYSIGAPSVGGQIPIQSTSTDWVVVNKVVELSAGTSIFLFNPPTGTEWNIDYFLCYKLEDGTLVKDIYDIQNEITNKPYYPKKSTSKTAYSEYLSSFISKYSLRQQDVTIVQIGDSESTDLNWTEKRPDVNERPPFMTEYNVNSYLEEKLRWVEQKYRRFDFSGIFTETLGGGVSTIKEVDPYWGVVGAANYLPITKVIDGGSGSGVSFSMPADMKRISLIVHTDMRWATSTQINISEGNGKVEVFDIGTGQWAEANGFVLVLKEPDTSVSLGFYTDSAQKRLKFRSTLDLTAKTISVTNVGSGRFGYWGIEYSPNDFLFTYIAASKGSQNLYNLERFESFMVDAFNPDLLIWQIPVLNHAFGVSRAFGSDEYAIQFISKYEALKAKGYLVFPYVLWAATYSNFVDTNGQYQYSKAANGKIITCQGDAANVAGRFYSTAEKVPCINTFPIITEIAKEKSADEGGNIYSSALVSSGKSGETFTFDGIHLNKLGEEIAWRILEENFNF